MDREIRTTFRRVVRVVNSSGSTYLQIKSGGVELGASVLNADELRELIAALNEALPITE